MRFDQAPITSGTPCLQAIFEPSGFIQPEAHYESATARFLAIAKGDQHVAYQTLKLLRPWKPALKAQLKDSAGFLPPESSLPIRDSPKRRAPCLSLLQVILVSSPGISPQSDRARRFLKVPLRRRHGNSVHSRYLRPSPITVKL